MTEQEAEELTKSVGDLDYTDPVVKEWILGAIEDNKKALKQIQSRYVF